MVQLTDLLKEIRHIKISVDKVENIVERRLIGVEEPLKDERLAGKRYDKLKEKGAVEYVSLKEAQEETSRQKY